MELQRKMRKKWEDIFVIAAMGLIVAFVIVINRNHPVTYTMLTSESANYEKGVVREILEENLEQEKGSSRYRGTQKLMVELRSGEDKGREIEVVNELSATHNILAKVGQRLVIKVDAPEGLTPFYAVFNYDRSYGLLFLFLLFAGFMALVGGTKGVRSMIGLAFALFLVIGLLLPAIYHGWSPIGMGLACALLITVFSMLLLNGFSRKTLVAVASTMAGVILAAALYCLFSNILHLSGFNMDEAEELIVVQNQTGLQVGQVLFTGILIASLGAVMDMTMSVASALFEIKQVHPEMQRREVFRSGINIGRDMIGTMCETLILAFAGTGITSLLVLIAYGAQMNQILSSDYVALEVIHSFTGGLAVILAVPLTAALTSFWTKQKNV